MDHVVFLKADPLRRVAEGLKRHEIRLSRTRHPAWRTAAGDTLLLKLSGGGILLRATAREVHRFEALRPQDIDALADLFCDPAHPFSRAYWRDRRDARFAVIVELADVSRVHFPESHTPRGVFNGWVRNFPHAHLATPATEEVQRFEFPIGS